MQRDKYYSFLFSSIQKTKGRKEEIVAIKNKDVKINNNLI